jgi:hypothetical protein
MIAAGYAFWSGIDEKERWWVEVSARKAGGFSFGTRSEDHR